MCVCVCVGSGFFSDFGFRSGLVLILDFGSGFGSVKVISKSKSKKSSGTKIKSKSKKSGSVYSKIWISDSVSVGSDYFAIHLDAVLHFINIFHRNIISKYCDILKRKITYGLANFVQKNQINKLRQ